MAKRSSAHVSSKDNIFVYRVASVKCSQIIFGKAIFHARIIKNIFRRRHIIMLSENHIYRFSLYQRKSFRCKLVYDFRRSFCFYRYPFALYLGYKLDFFTVFVRLSVFLPALVRILYVLLWRVLHREQRFYRYIRCITVDCHSFISCS